MDPDEVETGEGFGPVRDRFFVGRALDDEESRVLEAIERVVGYLGHRDAASLAWRPYGPVPWETLRALALGVVESPGEPTWLEEGL